MITINHFFVLSAFFATINTVAKNDKPKEIVFITKGDSAKIVEVKTGIQDNQFIEITEGLTGDEEVVTAPYSAISRKLKDKMLIKKAKTKEWDEAYVKRSKRLAAKAYVSKIDTLKAKIDYEWVNAEENVELIKRKNKNKNNETSS